MISTIKTIIPGLLFCSFCAFAQESKQPLTVDDLSQWQRITEKAISDDGNFIAIKHEPWKGDATVRLYDKSGNELKQFHSAGEFKFSPSSQYLTVIEKPTTAETEALKLKKTKREKMPMDKLILFNTNGQEEILDSVRIAKISDATDWFAYQRGSKKDSTLIIRSIDGRLRDSIPGVSDFGFAEEGAVLYYVSAGDTVDFRPGLYTYQTKDQSETIIKEGKGDYQKPTFNKAGNKLAFLYAEEAEKDSTDEKKDYVLLLSSLPDSARTIATKTDQAFPEDWIISQHGRIVFSENNEFLFFGVSPAPQERDTTVLPENRPNVQIWNWDESVQYTQQQVDRKRDERQTYTVAYNLQGGKTVLLNSPEYAMLQLPDNGYLALASNPEPYGTERMWTGKSKQDVYIQDIRGGERTLLLKANSARIRISPAGKYGYWYNETDSSWYTCNLASKQIYRLTTPESFPAWNTDNDVPDYPYAYGDAGWSKDDQAIYLYDRYDIWKFNPDGSGKPVNMTVNGNKQRITYRRVRLDKDEKFIDTHQSQLLTGFNEKTKATGFYASRLNKTEEPKALLIGDFKASFVAKAKKADALLYTTESFSRYPDISYSDLSLKKTIQLTTLGEQQENYIWGTAELTSWTTLDGQVMEGVIYKPANFDPNKKYPLLVNFYERNSDTFYSYRMPEPHRSTIDYHLYNSNGYIIFNPDIRYTVGYPGESCFKSVMPGIMSLIKKGYINEKAIGAQGHSWGGYQVAYLATRTSLFAAIESGAPVVNMFSAYGGIRWGTGLNRSFQYEHGQSRIGGTPWETPLRYQENSPLFTMDKVTTPILIMHNDADGHVPWYQGIEYFVALKRLQKPVWLLNYTGEPHWPLRMANRIDFQTRMLQFFDHYLKGESMPKWMREGVKAVNQPFELGY
jgi:dipeptidyl aminopeptidase/acylaminoacyl peptidase